MMMTEAVLMNFVMCACVRACVCVCECVRVCVRVRVYMCVQ